MSVHPYINFSGNCREAVNFYADVFETERPNIFAFGDAPGDPDHPVPDEFKNWVMHTQLKIQGSLVMFSDVFPGYPVPFNPGNNFSLAVVSKDIDELKSIFQKLQDGGSVQMELQETSWSKCYGSVIDKFGINWQVDHDAE